MKTITLVGCVVISLMILAQPPRPATAESLRTIAQNDRDKIITAQFDAMIGAYSKRNITLHAIGDLKLGDLKPKESYLKEFQLEAGRKYIALGACDSDCKDLNILIHDEDGRVVAKDVGSDDHPIVTMVAEHSGAYKVETARK